MANLGDFFGENFKKEFAERNIKVGSVIKCFVLNTNPPKEKRFVVLGITENKELIGAVFINTEINFKVMNNPILEGLQYLIKVENNEFLAYDSYLDCSQIIGLDHEYIPQNIQDKPEFVLGEVSQQDLINIITLLQRSPKITPTRIETVWFSLTWILSKQSHLPIIHTKHTLIYQFLFLLIR